MKEGNYSFTHKYNVGDYLLIQNKYRNIYKITRILGFAGDSPKYELKHIIGNLKPRLGQRDIAVSSVDTSDTVTKYSLKSVFEKL